MNVAGHTAEKPCGTLVWGIGPKRLWSYTADLLTIVSYTNFTLASCPRLSNRKVYKHDSRRMQECNRPVGFMAGNSLSTERLLTFSGPVLQGSSTQELK